MNIIIVRDAFQDVWNKREVDLVALANLKDEQFVCEIK